MKKILLFTCASALAWANAFAQKEANMWCFGAAAGLDFNSGSPVFFPGVAMNQWEGCTSIADANGNLLFYSDGQTVWNRNHIAMPNGFGLLGDPSSTQSGLIVKQPNTNDIYYLFTTAAQFAPTGFNYSIIDMTLQGGMGDVTAKNVNLLPFCDERVTGTFHANGNDIWVITTSAYSDSIYSFLFTSAGISTAPVASYNGVVHNINVFNNIGNMKTSQAGDKLAFACYEQRFELYDYNNNTGIATNPIIMDSSVYAQAYGIEFSPDGTRLYGAEHGAGYNVFQFDLMAGSAQAIINSSTLVGTSAAGYAGELQLAPDMKIYLARWTSQFLGVINDPNALGLACSYVDNGVTLPSGTCNGGLPNFIAGIFAPQNPPVINFVASDRFICPGTCINFTNFTTGATSYQWTFNGASPDTSTMTNPSFICYNTPGLYSVTLIATNAVGSDTVTLNNLIHIYPQPVTPTITQIGNDLHATGGFSSYQWYYGSDTISGATNSVYTATQNGNYNLVVVDSNGCTVGVGILNVVVEGGDGINEFNVQGLKFNVYPNPARNQFAIHNAQCTNVVIEIYNCIGEKVYATISKEKEKEVTINTTSFAGGIYLVKVSSGENIFTKKIVIEK